jgi:hypothetical protein
MRSDHVKLYIYHINIGKKHCKLSYYSYKEQDNIQLFTIVLTYFIQIYKQHSRG